MTEFSQPLIDVDAEALVSTFLRAALAEEVGGRVYTDAPQQRTYPLVVLQRVGGTSASAFAIAQVRLRIEVYGDTHAETFDLTALLIAVCTDELPGQHALGCVSGFTATGTQYDPDPEATDAQGHARPRYVIEATVYCHP